MTDHMDTDDLAHLLSEVIIGIPAEESTLPDTPEWRAKREEYAREVAESREKGLTPMVPSEWA